MKKNESLMVVKIDAVWQTIIGHSSSSRYVNCYVQVTVILSVSVTVSLVTHSCLSFSSLLSLLASMPIGKRESSVLIVPYIYLTLVNTNKIKRT